MIAHAQSVGHNCQGRIYRSTRTEHAAINHIQIIDFMRLTIAIERARPGVVAEPDRAVLMRDPGEWDALTEEKIAREQTFVALMSVHLALGLLLHERSELFNQSLVSFLVVRLVL